MSENLAELHCHRPVLSRQPSAQRPVFVSGNTNPVPEGFWSHDMPDGVPPSTVSFSGRPYALGQVNHYMVRTPDAFQLKAGRGRGAVARRTATERPRYTDGYYQRFNRNETADTRIDRYATQAIALRETLLKDPKVAQAHGACCRAAGLSDFS